MILDNLPREALIELLKRGMVQVVRDHETLKAGEWYNVDQDQDYVTVYDDGYTVAYWLTYAEAERILGKSK